MLSWLERSDSCRTGRRLAVRSVAQLVFRIMAHLESLPNNPESSVSTKFKRVRESINARRMLRVGAIGAALFSPLAVSRETIHYDIPDFYGPPSYIAGRVGETTYDTKPGADIICLPQDTQEIASLQKLTFQASDFVDMGTNQTSEDALFFEQDGRPTHSENTHILLMQVDGDESENCKIHYIAREFMQAFEQLPITISYLRKPVPIPFTRANERLVRGPEESEAVMDAIRKSTGRNYDKALVFLNTDIFFGTTNYTTKHDIAFTALHNPESLYVALHEGGHLLGLDDGYRHNITYDKVLTSSELTFGHQYTEDEARAAFDPQRPDKLIPTGTVVNGKQVFARHDPSFDGFNLMRWANSQSVRTRQKAGQPLLTPFQVRYISEHLKRER